MTQKLSEQEVELRQIAATTSDGAAMATAVIATLAGVAFPKVAAALGLGAAGLELCSKFLEQRNEKRFRRLETAILNLYQRLEAIGSDAPRPKIDHLFLEIAEALVTDDEEDKRVFYETALLWVTTAAPTHAQARAVRLALRDLSFIEIVYFIRAVSGNPDQSVIEGELGLALVWNHLIQAGFCGQSFDPAAHLFFVGEVIMKFSDMSEVEKVWRGYEARRRQGQGSDQSQHPSRRGH